MLSRMVNYFSLFFENTCHCLDGDHLPVYSEHSPICRREMYVQYLTGKKECGKH